MTIDESITQVQADPTVVQILQAEPFFQQVLNLAAHLPTHYNRWYGYEALKRMGRAFVGWDAPHEELHTCEHYHAMIWAIDLLLPIEGEERPYQPDYASAWDDLMESLDRDEQGYNLHDLLDEWVERIKRKKLVA